MFVSVYAVKFIFPPIPVREEVPPVAVLNALTMEEATPEAPTDSISKGEPSGVKPSALIFIPWFVAVSATRA